MYHYLLTLGLVLLVLFGCSSDDNGSFCPEQPPAEVTQFLNEMIDSMMLHSINKHTIDWQAFRTDVLSQARCSQAIGDPLVSSPIGRALFLLGDQHSAVIDTSQDFSSVSCPSYEISAPSLPSNIGYVQVRSYISSSLASNCPEPQEYISSIHEQIKAYDQRDTSIDGWIVDLRGNGGGSLPPMIAGLGPLLGEGVCLYCIDADQKEQIWSYSEGSCWVDNERFTPSVTYSVRNREKKIAVLIDSSVASSGEGVVISFIGLSNSKSFGSVTAGVSTCNTPFYLSNGWILNLTTSEMADRNRRTYGQSISPDVITPREETLSQAVEWILEGEM